MSNLHWHSCYEPNRERNVPAVVSELVLDAFARLPRNGKPSDAQWTVLAGFVAVPTSETEDGSDSEQAQLISLATGTKCLGRSQRRPELVCDSHAEVLARRLFNRQLLDEIHAIFTGKSSQFLSFDSSGLCAWRQNQYSLYLYVSRAPCGDSVICDKEQTTFPAALLLPGESTVSSSSSLNDVVVLAAETATGSSDIHRTGAKPVPSAGQDPRRTGKEYHAIGLPRTKPGRGEPTDCMSCSDKISRWVACGVQSRLLATFLAGPIPLAGLVLGGDVFDESALRRAFLERHSCPLNTLNLWPAPNAGKSTFRHDRKQGAERCSTSLLIRRTGQQEIAVDGRRHGIVKKHIGSPKAELSICRRQLLLTFRSLVRELLEGQGTEAYARLAPLLTTSYADTKLKSTPAWLTERRALFNAKMLHWTTKDAQDFYP